MDTSRFSAAGLRAFAPEMFEIAVKATSPDELRKSLYEYAHKLEYEIFEDYASFEEGSIIRVRDCARILYRILNRRSENMAQFSVVQAVMDIAQDKPRPELSMAFYADLMHLFLGLLGRGPGRELAYPHLVGGGLQARDVAIERSRQLDKLSEEMRLWMDRYPTGLSDESIRRRAARRDRILRALGADLSDWYSWNWQIANIRRDTESIEALLRLSAEERLSIERTRTGGLPFGITPHYLSLMDDEAGSTRDRAIRAQVIPPQSYIREMLACKREGISCLDFMKEGDTSPIDLITRRYPAICIFKPLMTCPQICVYCQRNWEVEGAMVPDALASGTEIDASLKWIEEHPAIHEVLVTGGDPLCMSDEEIERILVGLSRIKAIERIRIGSRTPVTVPMRITDKLADLLAGFRVPGRRRIALVTHVQHPYELTPDTGAAVEKLLIRGVPVYNQMVFTFFVSRRFEAASLRRSLALLGIESYYTFNTKGKEETLEYRVPIARLQQEQKEEARLLPGLTRTDEAVFNIPGLGKHYLRARQHRDLISILPSGARLYEFHPWEKNISRTTSTYVCEDIPVLDYIQRLEAIGENASDYATIWYYF